MHQEPADEFFTGDGDFFPLPLVFVVFGSKGNSAVRHAFNTVVADRDPVCILPEIFDNGLRAIKRFLAVRNPFFAVTGVQQFFGRIVVFKELRAAVEFKFSIFPKVFQLRKILATEKARNDPDRKKELDDNLMLFYTGVQRFSSEIQADTFAKPVDKTKQLFDMLALVDEAQAILTNKDASLNEFGKLLDYTWELKRGTGNKVSNNSIDELYNRGIKAGALGGKLLGAGGGGFLLFYVEKDKQENVLKALDELMHVPFQFESEGSTVIHYNPIVYIPRKEIKID